MDGGEDEEFRFDNHVYSIFHPAYALATNNHCAAAIEGQECRNMVFSALLFLK